MLYVPSADMYGQMRSAGCYAQRTEETFGVKVLEYDIANYAF
jgi:hypothetical protein